MHFPIIMYVPEYDVSIASLPDHLVYELRFHQLPPHCGRPPYNAADYINATMLAVSAHYDHIVTYYGSACEVKMYF